MSNLDSSGKVIFKNRKAAILWVFAALFLSFVAAMSWIHFRFGPPTESSPDLIRFGLMVFWVGAFGLAAYASEKHCLVITIQQKDKSITVTYRYPFKKRIFQYSREEAGVAQIRESKDDDGNPYFYANVQFMDNSRVALAEGHDKKICEKACLQFNTIISAI